MDSTTDRQLRATLYILGDLGDNWPRDETELAKLRPVEHGPDAAFRGYLDSFDQLPRSWLFGDVTASADILCLVKQSFILESR